MRHAPPYFVLSNHLPLVIAALTSGRDGPGPHWVRVVEVEGGLPATVTPNELKAALEHAVSLNGLKASGIPPHSVALFEPPC